MVKNHWKGWRTEQGSHLLGWSCTPKLPEKLVVMPQQGTGTAVTYVSGVKWPWKGHRAFPLPLTAGVLLSVVISFAFVQQWEVSLERQYKSKALLSTLRRTGFPCGDANFTKVTLSSHSVLGWFVLSGIPLIFLLQHQIEVKKSWSLPKIIS